MLERLKTIFLSKTYFLLVRLSKLTFWQRQVGFGACLAFCSLLSWYISLLHFPIQYWLYKKEVKTATFWILIPWFLSFFFLKAHFDLWNVFFDQELHHGKIGRGIFCNDVVDQMIYTQLIMTWKKYTNISDLKSSAVRSISICAQFLEERFKTPKKRTKKVM